MKESTVDYPQKDLSPEIWMKTDNSYVIRPDVKKIILNVLSNYDIINIQDIAETIHITGSIGTNQITDDADIDVHIVTDSSKIENAELIQKDVFKHFRKEGNVTYIGMHPIEVYIQFNPEQELLSDAVYDLLEDTWIIGPKIVADTYDPLEDFSDVLVTVQELAGEADINFGKLKRKTIDYSIKTKALENLDGRARKNLLSKLKGKLDEIEQSIESLMKLKGQWIQMRRDSSKASPDKALEDIKTAKTWRDANACFKFLSRYHYMKTISKLEQMLDDDKLDSNELNRIKQMMGV